MIRISRTVGLALCASIIGLQGCADIQKAIGNTKQAPDEFAVVAHPPLSVPPNFTLRPPTPGERRPQERDVTKNAERLVLGSGNRALFPAVLERYRLLRRVRQFRGRRRESPE